MSPRWTIFLFCLALFSPSSVYSSPDWFAPEGLTDLLHYHHLLGEERFDEAGQVLERLLKLDKSGSHLKTLAVEYYLKRYELKPDPIWLARAEHSLGLGMGHGDYWRSNLAASRLALLKGNSQEALGFARRIIDDYEANHQAWSFVLDLAQKEAQGEEQKQIFEGAYLRGFLAESGIYNLGVLRLRESDLSGAIECFEAIQSSHDRILAGRAINALFVLYRETLQYEKAKLTLAKTGLDIKTLNSHQIMIEFLENGLFNSALELSDSDLSVYSPEQRAILFLVAGETNQAREIIATETENLGFASAMVGYYVVSGELQRAKLALFLARIAFENGKTALALSWHLKAGKHLGKSAYQTRDWLGLKAELDLIRQDWAGAKATASIALKIAPNQRRLLSVLAYANARQGNNAQAVKFYLEAGDPAGALSYAEALLKESRYQEALEYSRAIIEVHPLDASARRIEALSLMGLRKRPQAIESLSEWYTQGGRDLEALMLYARLESESGDLSLALELINEAISSIKTRRSLGIRLSDNQLARLYALRGAILQKSGIFAEAVKDFEQAVTIGDLSSSELAELYLEYGNALMDLGRATSAFSAWRKVQDYQPGETRSLELLKEHQTGNRRVFP